MFDELAAVRSHYNPPGLTERLKQALSALGGEHQRLKPEQLGGLDQFHTRGLAATADLAELAGLTSEHLVLDVGSGLGGPARYLAATYGCEVLGVDLSEAFVEAAQYLTMRTDQSERVSFEIGSALDLPFSSACFDVALLQHVAMNIQDRSLFYREMRRVLKAKGRFAIFDVVLRGGEVLYPVPWARTAATSTLLTAEATQAAIEQAGFRVLAWRDDTDAAKAWFAQQRASGPPQSLNLGLVMGAEFPELAANLARNLMEGRLGVLSAVFEAI